MEIEIPFWHEVELALPKANGELGRAVPAWGHGRAALHIKEAAADEMIPAFLIRQAKDATKELGAFPDPEMLISRLGGRLYRRMTPSEARAFRSGPVGQNAYDHFWRNFMYHRGRGLILNPETTRHKPIEEEARSSLLGKAQRRSRGARPPSELAQRIQKRSFLEEALSCLENISHAVLSVDGELHLLCGEPLIKEPYPGAPPDHFLLVGSSLHRGFDHGAMYHMHPSVASLIGTYTSDMVEYPCVSTNKRNHDLLGGGRRCLAGTPYPFSVEILDPVSLRVDPLQQLLTRLNSPESVLGCNLNALPIAELPSKTLDQIMRFRDLICYPRHGNSIFHRQMLLQLYRTMDEPGEFRATMMRVLRIATEGELPALYPGYRARTRMRSLLELLEGAPINKLKFWGGEQAGYISNAFNPSVEVVLTKEANTGLLEFLSGDEVQKLEEEAALGKCRIYRLARPLDDPGGIARLPYAPGYAYCIETGDKRRFFGASEHDFLTLDPEPSEYAADNFSLQRVP